jgi:hypothetical protein
MVASQVVASQVVASQVVASQVGRIFIVPAPNIVLIYEYTSFQKGDFFQLRHSYMSACKLFNLSRMESSACSAYRSDVSIATLADRVSEVSGQITAYLDKNKYAHPNFTRESTTIPEAYEYDILRNQLHDAAFDLLRLASGPKRVFRTMSFWHTDLAAVQVALCRNFFRSVPDDDVGLSATEIAEAAGMDVDRATRVLKMLATHRIFEEVDDKFRHTAASAFLKKHIYASMAEEQLDDCFKASSELDSWIGASPYKIGELNSAFVKRFGSDFYRYHDQNPEKAKRFSDAMSGWSTSKYVYIEAQDYADLSLRSTTASLFCVITSTGCLL